MIPLYEAKMIHHFDYRWATYEPDGTTRLVTAEEKADPTFVVMPRYWVAEREVEDKIGGRTNAPALLGWRDICRGTDARTLISGLVPRTAVGDKFLLAFPQAGDALSLQAMWSSFAVDFATRQKIGGTSLKYFTFMQLPSLLPTMLSAPAPWSTQQSSSSWIRNRSSALNTDWTQLDRSFARAELDAAFFRLYGIARDDVDYIMDTFPIVKRKDETEFGEYRTKRMILEIYDAMAYAEASGVPYSSELTEDNGG